MTQWDDSQSLLLSQFGNASSIIDRYLLKSSIVSTLSEVALKPSASDLEALQQLLVDQANLPKEEVQLIFFDIVFAEEIF